MLNDDKEQQLIQRILDNNLNWDVQIEQLREEISKTKEQLIRLHKIFIRIKPNQPIRSSGIAVYFDNIEPIELERKVRRHETILTHRSMTRILMEKISGSVYGGPYNKGKVDIQSNLIISTKNTTITQDKEVGKAWFWKKYEQVEEASELSEVFFYDSVRKSLEFNMRFSAGVITEKNILYVPTYNQTAVESVLLQINRTSNADIKFALERIEKFCSIPEIIFNDLMKGRQHEIIETELPKLTAQTQKMEENLDWLEEKFKELESS